VKQSKPRNRKLSGKKSDGSISRRRFIRDVSVGTAGLAMATTLPGLTRSALGSTRDLSKVVVARHPDSVITAYTFDQSIVGEMVNTAITEFTGQEAPGLAWASLFPEVTSSTVIGIKVNCFNTSGCCSRPEMAYAVAEGLVSMPVAGGHLVRNNIIIWDCKDTHLSGRGDFSTYTGSDPDRVRCFGSNTAGYNTGAQFQVNGKTVTPSNLLTTDCDYLVNLGVLKDHSMAGVTLGMKNHLGSINEPTKCHDINPDVPRLNVELRTRFPDASGYPKEKLIIIDALTGVAGGGPTGPPTFIYHGLVMGSDIVAVDAQGRAILQDNGWDGDPMATYIDTAAGAPYNLGNSDPEQIDLVEHNPIPPATRGYVDRMIRFHKEGLATALQVEWAVNRYARGK